MTTGSHTSGDRSYAFVFVCQRGELEGMALLLAASLKRFLRCRYELIAAVPTPIEKWGEISSETRRLLNQMNVRIEFFENLISGEKKGDFLTNKIYCLQIPTSMDKMIFLDSDILCLREFDDEERFAIPFNAAPTFRATGRNWDKVYAAVGMSVPTEQMQTLFSNETQPPYFNSGFVAIDTSLAAQLSHEWLDCFHKIDASNAMQDNPYYREQVSLVVAVKKMGLTYDILDQRYNFWVKSGPMDVTALPYFLHHTWPHPPLYDQPILKRIVRSLVDEYPGMRKFVARCRWKYYLRPDLVVSINRRMFNSRKHFKKMFGSVPV